MRTRSSGGVVILLLAACSRSTVEIPELPKLSLERVPEASRAEIHTAYESVRAKPEDPAANGHLGMILQAYEQFEPALICYQRARRLAPKDLRWTYYAATTHAALQQWEQAAGRFEEFLAAEPGYLPARLALARATLALGRLGESRRMYEDLAREHPRSFEVHYGMGRVLQAERRLKEAVAEFLQACEVVPRCGPAHYAMGLSLRDLGQTEEAGRELEAYRKDPTEVSQTSDALLAEVAAVRRASPLDAIRRALDLEARRDFDSAIRELEGALAAAPDLFQAQVNLIPLYGQTGAYEKAEETYRAAVKTHSRHADLDYNYGTVLLRQGKPAAAAEMFRRVLSIQPDHAEAATNLGQALEQTGKRAEAMEQYRLVVQRQPGFRLARFHFARLLLDQKRNSEARDALLGALAPEDEQTPLYLLALATAYHRSGEGRQAKEYLDRAGRLAMTYKRVDVLAAIDRERQQWDSGSGH